MIVAAMINIIGYIKARNTDYVKFDSETHENELLRCNTGEDGGALS